MVGHYAAGARLIGLTENQIRKHMERLKARHAAGDNKSPYAEPLHIVFGKVLLLCPMQTRFAMIINTLGITQIRLLKRSHVFHPISLIDAAKAK